MAADKTFTVDQPEKIEGSFTANIPIDIIKQIEVREKRFGRKIHTEEELEVINGNAVWVLLRSGVDVPINEAECRELKSLEARKSVQTSNKQAWAGILGGDLKPNGMPNYHLAGIEGADQAQDRAAYRLDAVQGHRAIPGITGFSVVSKDTWGMILEATVNIKVWSRDDLERMDLIYFKPGFTALLEWGHTLYFDSNDEIRRVPEPMISNEEFFAGGQFDDLDSKIYEARKRDCNREACFGYITNFSWKFNRDGSYDCTVKMVSKGAVLEGLKLKSGKTSGEADVQKDHNWWDISIFHKILKCFQDRYNYMPSPGTVSGNPAVTPLNETLDRWKMPGSTSKGEQKSLILSAVASINQGMSSIPKRQGTIISETDARIKKIQDFPVLAVPLGSGGLFHSQIEGFYIQLRSLLHLINVYELWDGDGYRGFYDLLSPARFGHGDDSTVVSLNPIVAATESQSEAISSKISLKALNLVTQSELRDADIIGNIWVDYSAFCAVVARQIDAQGSDYRIDLVLREFLSEIQKALGNIHNFGVHTNQMIGGNCYEIVDLASVRTNKDKNIPRDIGVSGLFNTVLDLNVESDVSSDIVNEMCIAAAAPTTSEDGAESADECMVFWGENCKSRWTPKPLSSGGSSKNTKSSNDSREGFDEKLAKLYKRLRRGKLDKKAHGEQVQTDAIQANIAEELIDIQLTGEKLYLDKVRTDLGNKSNLQMGIIPVRLNLTMLGLSRLTIGNTFRIKNGVLPRKYDNWGYIITGIEHRVQGGQWVTQLKTQYYPVYPDNTYNEGRSSSSSTVSSSNLTSEKNVVTGERTARRGPYKDILENVCDYRVAFIKGTGIDYGAGNKVSSNGYKSPYMGWCAAYTFNWARVYTQGKKACETGAKLQKHSSNRYDYDANPGIGTYIPQVPAGGNAGSAGYAANLESIGYQPGNTVTMSDAELRKVTAGTNVGGKTVKEGDVLVYTGQGGSPYHTCFFDGTKWRSDADQNSANCYGSRGNYKVQLFSCTKPKHKDWNCSA